MAFFFYVVLTTRKNIVSPKWVPEMADSAQVYNCIKKCPGIVYPVLTPNESLLRIGAKEMATFGTASDAQSFKNVNCTAAESIERFWPVLEICS